MTVNQPSEPMRVSPSGTLLVNAGYPGASIRIRQGALHIDCGFGRELRVRRSSKPRLRRLIVLGRAGWWSFEVPAWLEAVGASWAHLGRNGTLLGSGPGEITPDLPRLRAAQAVASYCQTGVEVSRRLVVEKLANQLQLAEERFPDAAREHAAIAAAHDEATEADTIDAIRSWEADGAAAYFAAWRGRVRPRFAARDQHRVPPAWMEFTGRTSAIGGSAQRASDVVNALVNLEHALLLTEAIIATRRCGLDCGIPLGLHAAQPGRPNGALDVLEPARPAAEAIIIDLVAGTIFSRKDFAERADGSVRISTGMVRHLLDTMPTLAAAVAPVVEGVAQALADSADLGRVPTPLTGTNRRRSRPRARARQAAPARVAAPSRCRECGTQIPTGRVLCDTCHPEVNHQRLISMNEAVTAARRTSGLHPAQTREVRTKIADRQREQWQERASVGDVGGWTGDASEFRRLILPGLAGLPPSQIAAATNLSVNYSRLVRDGKRVPHVRHWGALRLVGLA